MEYANRQPEEPGVNPAADLTRDQSAERMRRRRLAMLPLRGPGAAYTAGQSREPGDSTTPAELSDLISSIAEIGVLHPILVEETPAKASDRPQLRVVAGERRLRACRWKNQPKTFSGLLHSDWTPADDTGQVQDTGTAGALTPVPDTLPEGSAAGIPVLAGGEDLLDSTVTLLSYSAPGGPREVLFATVTDAA